MFPFSFSSYCTLLFSIRSLFVSILSYLTFSLSIVRHKEKCNLLDAVFFYLKCVK